MKEWFEDTKFRADTMRIIKLCNAILNEYAQQGYDLSLRQLYYQLVARGHIDNTVAMYKSLGNTVTNARVAGLLDWSMIVDRGRVPKIPSTWEDPAGIIEDALKVFQIDRWEKQPNYVEVMVEKDALAGVLLPICQKHQVTFSANKGYSSASAMYRAGKRMVHEASKGKNLHILYLGDHDPSGLDMDRDIIERVELFSGYRAVSVNRLALKRHQIDEMDIPENPAKLTDSRGPKYVSLHGYASWELDAMEPRQLVTLLEDAILDLRHTGLFNETMERENKMRSQLEDIVEGLEDV